MTARSPLSQRCKAHSTRTGEQCKLWVIDPGPNPVCRAHGGAARQTVAKRKERVLVAELQAADPEAYKERTPAEALLAATKSADLVAQKLESELARLGVSEPGLLNVFGDWISKVGTVAKAAIDTDAEARVKASREAFNADVMAAVMAFAYELLAAAGLTYAQRDAVRAVLLAVRNRTAHRTITSRTADDLHDVPAFDVPSPLPLPEIVGDVHDGRN